MPTQADVVAGQLIERTGFSCGRGNLEGVEYCAHGEINAGEYDGFHDPVGTEHCFRLTVERLAQTMLHRQCAGDAVGNRLFVREVLRQPGGGKCSHCVVGVTDMPGDGAMCVELDRAPARLPRPSK